MKKRMLIVGLILGLVVGAAACPDEAPTYSWIPVYEEEVNIPVHLLFLLLKLEERKKPWGTGQAILCCKDVVQEPFLVINADDYYGKEAYQVAYQYLSGKNTKDALDICMVGFVLENTLSEHGAVTRGVCKIDENHMLTDIEETFDILKKGEAAVGRVDEQEYSLPLHTPVSMNMCLRSTPLLTFVSSLLYSSYFMS